MASAALDLVVDLNADACDGPIRLMLHVPSGPAPASGWPVLYLVDGNAVFATARDIVRAQAPYPDATGVEPGIIAAVGYPVDSAYDPFRRSWDLTPPPGRMYPPFKDDGASVRTGGAVAYLDAFERTVKPFVEGQASVDLDRQALFGHSFGGLFTLFALYTRSALFDTYLAASPTLYWEDEVIRPFEDALSPLASTPRKRLLLSAGEWEGDELAPFQRSAPDAADRLAKRRLTRTIDMARDLARRLAERHGASVDASYETFAGENHMSVLPVAVNRAVQASFSVTRAKGR